MRVVHIVVLSNTHSFLVVICSTDLVDILVEICFGRRAPPKGSLDFALPHLLVGFALFEGSVKTSRWFEYFIQNIVIARWVPVLLLLYIRVLITAGWPVVLL